MLVRAEVMGTVLGVMNWRNGAWARSPVGARALLDVRFWVNNAEKVLKVLTFSCFLVELARLSGGDRQWGHAVAPKLRF